MISKPENDLIARAYQLARYGASAQIIGTLCGRSRRWGKTIIVQAGVAPTKRHGQVNRKRAFGRDPSRRAHAHIVIRTQFTLVDVDCAAERLLRLYSAYRAVARPAIFQIDEVFELVAGVLPEGAESTRVCAQCRQDWYQVASSAFTCPACEAFVAYVCKACGAAIPSEGPKPGEGFEARRGRPRRYCDNCPASRPRAKRKGRGHRRTGVSASSDVAGGLAGSS